MKNEIPAIELIDFYDHDSLTSLHEKRSKEWLKLWLKAKDGDPKAVRALRNQEAEDEVLRARANETGFYWV